MVRDDDADAAYLAEVGSSSIYLGILARSYGRLLQSRRSRRRPLSRRLLLMHVNAVATQQLCCQNVDVTLEETLMATSVFFSFHYSRDIIRVQKVANIGALDGQTLNRQNWEQVKRQGKAAIENYIDKEMAYKRAVVVLIGRQTAARPWVQYEIRKAWAARKPLVGIHINGLSDFQDKVDFAGPNPFRQFGFSDSSKTYADYIPVYVPSGNTSQEVYASISRNINGWIDHAYRRP